VPVDGLASVLVTEHHEGTKPALFVVRAFHGPVGPTRVVVGFSVEAEETSSVVRFV
jgi:hypothetical protein